MSISPELQPTSISDILGEPDEIEVKVARRILQKSKESPLSFAIRCATEKNMCNPGLVHATLNLIPDSDLPPRAKATILSRAYLTHISIYEEGAEDSNPTIREHAKRIRAIAKQLAEIGIPPIK